MKPKKKDVKLFEISREKKIALVCPWGHFCPPITEYGTFYFERLGLKKMHYKIYLY